MTIVEPISSATQPVPEITTVAGIPAQTRWSWACRVMQESSEAGLKQDKLRQPQAGDLALVQVMDIGSHERITLSNNQRLRIYPGDYIVGVFGNRYATDAYEALVEGTTRLSLLTAGGMIGTVQSRHRSMSRPTTLRFIGYLSDVQGLVLNLPQATFRPRTPLAPPRHLITMVGTGMNAGKTTSCVQLIKSLSSRGLRVGACKLTGSVSNRDQDEMKAAGAARVVDFSDYGFPSTYLCSKEQILSLYHTMMADLEQHRPDVIVMEIADGVLQRETRFLLEDGLLRQQIGGIMLAADNALSARYGVDLLKQLGHRVAGVTGLITSSPLCVREFSSLSDVPVAPSVGALEPLGDLAMQALGLPVHGRTE